MTTNQSKIVQKVIKNKRYFIFTLSLPSKKFEKIFMKKNRYSKIL